MIGRNVGIAIHRRQFVLCRGDFVVFGLGKNAHFPEFGIQIFHVGNHTGLDCAEIVVVQFLSFRATRTEQRTTGKHKVGTLFIERTVDEEIFLFGSGIGRNVFDFLPEKFQQRTRLAA